MLDLWSTRKSSAEVIPPGPGSSVQGRHVVSRTAGSSSGCFAVSPVSGMLGSPHDLHNLAASYWHGTAKWSSPAVTTAMRRPALSLGIWTSN